MARRLHQTMADYLVIAISPALIMALVGSLVFFLLRVFYQGDYQERLHWVMACFVFAAVLIGRISIEEGFERAVVFGAALAVVMGMAANQFMEFHGGWIESFSWIINWSLIALVWWCAHRLTWDCTLIDDSQDASGEGLLQTAGLETPATAEPDAQGAKHPEGTTSREVPAGFWQRYVENQRRPHAPGVWVVYFSLAALPLFGAGQWLIPESDVDGRRGAFWLLSVYVASGLGLLLTTSFLGLRRYLRQRRIEMPTLMANLWLATGAVIVGLLVVLAALLPRPSAEYPIAELPFSFGSPQQRSSRVAPVAKEGTRDEQPGSAPEREIQEQPQENDPAGDAEPAKGPQGDDSTDEARKSDNGQASDSQASSGAKSSPGKGAQGSSSSKSSSQAQQSSSDRKQADEPASPLEKTKQALRERIKEQAERARQAERAAETKSPPPDQAQSDPPPQSQAPTENSPQPAEQPPEPDGGQPPEQPAAEASRPLEIPQNLVNSAGGVAATLFKWIFYAIVILAVLYACWRYRGEIAAAFRDLLAALREFWSGLFVGQRRGRLTDGPTAKIKVPPAPFATFADPFATGIAGRYSLEELVRYSFEAFEAWSREHGCPRDPDQTPHELVREVGQLNAFIVADARNLAELYSRAAYARDELPREGGEQLRALWQKMRGSLATSPSSAAADS